MSLAVAEPKDSTPDALFAPRGNATEIETGDLLQPKFDANGLIPAIVSHTDTGAVLMFAWMNTDALARTLETSVAHFWSRSRGKLWMKGEESGNVLDVTAALTDCDQDVILLHARVRGDGVACHTGAVSCFYRKVELPDPANAGTAPTTPLRLKASGAW